MRAGSAIAPARADKTKFGADGSEPTWHHNLRKARSRARKAAHQHRATDVQLGRLAEHHGSAVPAAALEQHSMAESRFRGSRGRPTWVCRCRYTMARSMDRCDWCLETREEAECVPPRYPRYTKPWRNQPSINEVNRKTKYAEAQAERRFPSTSPAPARQQPDPTEVPWTTVHGKRPWKKIQASAERCRARPQQASFVLAGGYFC